MRLRLWTIISVDVCFGPHAVLAEAVKRSCFYRGAELRMCQKTHQIGSRTRRYRRRKPDRNARSPGEGKTMPEAAQRSFEATERFDQSISARSQSSSCTE